MRKFRKAAAVCIVEILLVVGGTTACGAKNDGSASVPQQQTAVAGEAQPQPGEIQQETVQPQPGEIQQETAPSDETQQTAAQPDTAQAATAQPGTAQQNTNQPVPVPGGSEQISLETAKSAALTDAGVPAADAVYTKEKLDYEDGIAVYEIEFYAGNTEYEYEINATTGAVYSKSVETYYDHDRHGHGHQGNAAATTTQTDIGAEGAKSIALNHAGFLAADVSRLKAEFDIDDGLSVYEVEFDKDGREYEYKINAADGTIIEYDID